MNKSVASLLLLGFILFGCSSPVNMGPDLTPGVDTSRALKTNSGSLIEPTTGEIGPGATYYIYIPPEWNQDLVLYVHGYVFPPEQFPPGLDLPSLPQLPQPKIDDGLLIALLSERYAVAYSTFSENGYALKDGVIRTRQLRGVFADIFDKPAHTYLVGYSLGGAISLMLAEKNPQLFSGALLVSGFVGGGQMQVNYVANAYLLFDYYFPGILYPIREIPEKYTLEELELLAANVFNALNTDIATGGTEIATMLSVRADGVPVFQARPGAPIEETLEAILSPLVFSLFGSNDILDRTHDHMLFDTSETKYYSVAEGKFLTLPKFEPTPDAANYVKHWYEPTGKLKIPVLALHNEYDAIVPYYHEAAYSSKVTDQGSSGMWEQWLGVAPFGHCNFSPGEIGAALQYLKTWVEALD